MIFNIMEQSQLRQILIFISGRIEMNHSHVKRLSIKHLGSTLKIIIISSLEEAICCSTPFSDR